MKSENMEYFKKLYEKRGGQGAPAPSFTTDWPWLILYGACVYLVVFFFRFGFADRWDASELWVNGERILATHDAYFWLAKAKGIGSLAGYPLAQAAHFIHSVTGVGLGTLGFWAPAFMGACVGVICFLWGWLISGKQGGIIAGVIGSLTPGFFYRSRLGYFDTDMFTLLMPMFVAWLLAVWSLNHTRFSWDWEGGAEENSRQSRMKFGLWQAFSFGVLTRFCLVWHIDIANVCVLYFLFTTVYVLVRGEKGQRTHAIHELGIFMLAAFPGAAYGQLWLFPSLYAPFTHLFQVTPFIYSTIMGIGLALLYLIAVNIGRSRNSSWVKNPILCGAIFLVLIYLVNLIVAPFPAIFEKLAGYLTPTAPHGEASGTEALGPIYPSIVQSIIEAKRVALSIILERGLFEAWLGGLALLMTVGVVIVRPVAVFLLPLIVLHLASVKLGVRFSMFGGAALSVCFGVGVYWISKKAFSGLPLKKWFILGSQCLVAALFLWFIHGRYSKIPLTPVIPALHAEALVELAAHSSPDSVVWTWWDWGYATQYYAGRNTVADGGKHAGRDVYPLAFALTTDSPKKANGMIAFSSQYPGEGRDWVGLYPARQWDSIPRSKLSETLDEQISKETYPARPGQFLVVTWKDIRIAQWITYFGNWNLQTGTTKQAAIGSYDPGKLGVNVQRGAIMTRNGNGGLVRDIAVLGSGAVERKEYFMNSMSPKLLPVKRHLLVNSVSKQCVLMDRLAYRSMLTRLLIGDPDDPEISKYFKLVVDKLPFARIYEVIQ